MSDPQQWRAVVFDVEGTLVDCVALILESWRETLSLAGHVFTVQELQPYSGMDGEWMLEQLLPRESESARKSLLEAQGKRYRAEFIHRARAFPGIRELFEFLNSAQIKIGIGTTCAADELVVYDQQLGIVKCADHVACGDTVKHGKPDPALFKQCLKALAVSRSSSALAVGDTPYDAQAAKEAGMAAIGVLSGGFSESSLRTAGCDEVIPEVQSLRRMCFPNKRDSH